MKENLSLEQNLIILASRLTISENEKRDILEIVKNPHFNWFEFYKYAYYHKTVTLCWKNIKDLAKATVVPKYLTEMISFSYHSLTQINKAYQDEVNNIVEGFKKEGIICIPVKGAMMIPMLYKDYGLRYMGDADFLIKFSDIKKVEELVKTKGYIKGKYSYTTGELIPISRADEIKWKTFLSNLYPYYKKGGNQLPPVFKIDFRYALDDTLLKEPLNEIIDFATQNNYVKACHYLIHLCTHFYDEAKHTIDIYTMKDLNIIKLCDIREYIIQKVTKEDLEELVEFAQKYNLEEQVYLTMYFLELIYGDGYERDVMDTLGINNENFINTYGNNTIHENNEYKRDVWSRLFSCNNADVLNSVPTLLK